MKTIQERWRSDVSNMIDIFPRVTFDDAKKAMCPQIVLNGWWWKKYIPHYRKQSQVMNDLHLHEWMNGGYEKHFEKIQELFDKDLAERLNSGFSTIYT